MTRSFSIDLNLADLNHYPLMVILDKCNGAYNPGNDLSTKICVRSKTKDLNVKTIDVMTRINGAKAVAKHSSCDCKCKFNSVTYDSNQKRNNKTGQCECKSYCLCKIDYSLSRTTCICKNSKCLKVLLVI